MSQASFNDDAQTVVQAIQDSVQTHVLNIGGHEFTSRPVYLPPKEADVSSLHISTLGGLAEYINENIDNHNFADLVVVIDSPRAVSVLAQIEGRKDSRVKWPDTKIDFEHFPFERFHSHEDFIIKAQALITNEHDREKLLKYIGNLKSDLIRTSTDDGVSQTVTVENGVRKAEIELPNPVILAPYRTFPEISQPSSPFVLRVQQSREGMMPQIGLFEADGGMWKREAIANIKQYLKGKLSDDAAVNIPVIG